MKKMSIVYLAINTDSVISAAIGESQTIICKIGETKHSDVRASQLKQKGERIDLYKNVPDNASLRKAMEAYLRLHIDAFDDAQLFGTDHFRMSLATYNKVRQNFFTWLDINLNEHYQQKRYKRAEHNRPLFIISNSNT